MSRRLGDNEARVVHTIAIDKTAGGILTIAAKVGDSPSNTDIWLISGNTRIGESFVQAFMGGERLTERDAEAAYQAAREERESRP